MFLFYKTLILVLRPTQSLIKWVLGIFPGVNPLGREVDHSLPCSIEVINEQTNISNNPICLHGVDMENFTFYICFQSPVEVS
jgi:hypothetical protein